MFKQIDSSGILTFVDAFTRRMPIDGLSPPITHASKMLLLFSIRAKKPQPVLPALASTSTVEEPPLRSYSSSTSRTWGILSGS